MDGGRHAAKRCVGDTVTVGADIFRDGHELLRAHVRYRGPGEQRWLEAPMRPVDAHLDGVRWEGSFSVDRPGRWQFAIDAWSDPFATWHGELRRKIEAGQHDLAGEIGEGIVLLRAGAERAAGSPADRRLIEHAAGALADPEAPEAAKHDAALGPELFASMERHAERRGLTTEPELTLQVDPVRARFGAWYELFPRSWGGLKGVANQLPKLSELGFDVIYLPPIHPIGRTNRKGANNALTAKPGDPGSPWAIGAQEGGHEAVHPDLGTLQDVKHLTRQAREHGIDIALDLAIQCSADHPWLAEHPEWFHRRPDGTLKYAENPPKRYQDIYNVNWECEDWRGLWDAVLHIVVHWVDHGIRIFRVDNPHTKPLPFWAWLIEEVHARDPEIVFLSEAFTRRRMMQALAKRGFDQSYTYFTWKNTRHELTEYITELAHTDDYFRPNFFVNTPDILHAYLQHGGPPAFHARLVLAATLSPAYGIYSGFEHYESTPLKPGSEEYLHSEKYEIKERALDGQLLPTIARLNRIRRENPALQHLADIAFLDTENDALIAYLKRHDGNAIVTVVNVDPHHPQEGLAIVPARLGLPPAFAANDLLAGARHDWGIGRNYVRLDPGQAHVLRVE